MKSGKGRLDSNGPEGHSGIETLQEQIEHERTLLAADRQRFEAERAAWQQAVGALNGGAADWEARLAQQQVRLDAQRRELEETLASLASREAQLDSQQLEIDRRETELEAQRREIAQANQQLLEARAEIQRLSEAVEGRHSGQQVDRLAEFYLQQQAELEAEGRQIQALHEQVQHNRETLAEDLARVEAEKNGLRKQSDDLQAKRDELAAQRRELEGERERLHAAQAQLQQDHAAMEAARVELRQRIEQLEQEQVQLRAQRDRLAAQSQQLEDQRASLTAEQTAIASRAEGIEKQRAALAAQREQLVERQTQLDTELDQLREAREKAQKEAEQQRLDLRRKLDQLDAQLAQVTERGHLLAARQKELDDRQAKSDEWWRHLEAEEHRLAEVRSECDRRAAELDRQIAEFAADRERILRTQAEFDARSAELDRRDGELRQLGDDLERLRRQLADQAADIQAKTAELEVQRSALAPKLEDLESKMLRMERERLAMEEQAQKLAQTRQQVEQHCQAAEAKVKRQVDQLTAAKAEFERQTQAVSGTKQNLVEEQKRLAEQLAHVEAERKALERERLEASKEVAEERSALDKRREELTRQAADLAERERRLAEEVATLQKAIESQSESDGRPVIVEVGGFSLRRALVASALFAVAAAVAVVVGIGPRREVQGIISLTTESPMADALGQYADALRSHAVLSAAAQSLDADIRPDDIRAMMGPGGVIEIRTFPDESQIRLRAVTTDPKRARAIIGGLGEALKARINNPPVMHDSASGSAPEELKALQARGARLRQERDRAMGELSRIRSEGDVRRPDPSAEVLQKQWAAVMEKLEPARQAAQAAEQRLAAFSTSQTATEVDATALQNAFAEDPQLRQDMVQLRLREQQLRGYLLDGLDAARQPLTSLVEKIGAFDREVASKLEGRNAEDVEAALKRIRAELATCRQVTADVRKDWEGQLQKLRRSDNPSEKSDMTTEQQQAERVLSEFLDRLSQPIMAINAQVQAIAQTGGEDMTRRIVIQDALRKQAEELTSARRTFANVGAEIIPMSNPRLEACLKQVAQLQRRVVDRQKQIAAGMERRVSDQANEQREQRRLERRTQAAQLAASRDRLVDEVLRLTVQLGQAYDAQMLFERRQAAVQAAEEKVKLAEARLAEADADMEALRRRTGNASLARPTDRADFSGAVVAGGIANQRQLAVWAAGAAVLAFAVTWALTWVVANGHQPPPRVVSKPRKPLPVRRPGR